MSSRMEALHFQFNSYRAPSFSSSYNFKNQNSQININTLKCPKNISFSCSKIKAIGTLPEQETEAIVAEEPPTVKFAFVSSVLFPDGTPDVHYRKARGGQKLRDIMLDSNIELYGPYSRPLLNCGGGGTCATCMVEVIEGKELLSPRTEKEKEKLKRNPKNWRLACQTTVGDHESTGMLTIQQLPEWKGHEWKYGELPLSDSDDDEEES